MPIAGLAVQSSLLRADGNGPSAIADFQGLNLRGALNQGHSGNPRQLWMGQAQSIWPPSSSIREDGTNPSGAEDITSFSNFL